LGITKDEILKFDLLKNAVRNGKVEVLKYFRELGITKQDAIDNEVAIIAIINENTNIIDELRNWGFTKEDLKIMDEQDETVLEYAVRSEDPNIVRYFRKEWGFTKEDMNDLYPFNLTLEFLLEKTSDDKIDENMLKEFIYGWHFDENDIKKSETFFKDNRKDIYPEVLKPIKKYKKHFKMKKDEEEFNQKDKDKKVKRAIRR
jgi:hypothetical protein